jgi:hypothetical protein
MRKQVPLPISIHESLDHIISAFLNAPQPHACARLHYSARKIIYLVDEHVKAHASGLSPVVGNTKLLLYVEIVTSQASSWRIPS